LIDVDLAVEAVHELALQVDSVDDRPVEDVRMKYDSKAISLHDTHSYEGVVVWRFDYYD
jgi:hypothetical protein